MRHAVAELVQRAQLEAAVAALGGSEAQFADCLGLRDRNFSQDKVILILAVNFRLCFGLVGAGLRWIFGGK